MTQPFNSPESYKHFKKEIARIVKIRTEQLTKKLRATKRRLTEETDVLHATKKNLAIETDSDIKKIQKQQIKDITKKTQELQNQIKDLEVDIKKLGVTISTQNDFLELCRNFPILLGEMRNMKVLDTFLKKIFSNFSVTQKNVVDYSLNAPFEAFEALNGIEIPKCGR